MAFMAMGVSVIGIIVAVVLAVALLGGIIALIMVITNKNKNPAPVPTGDGSYFDGGTLGLIGWRILAGLLTTITLGIAFPWALCMLERWKAKHTVINGRRLKFTGSGIGLLGRFLLWSFLTLITFGIFGIWLGLNIEKWRVKHLVYEDDESGYESEFTAGVGGWFVNCLIKFLITFFTLGIGYSWAEVKFMKWKAQHTVINGSSLVFSGTGGQLFVKYLLFWLLTPLTLGIYALFFPVILLKWEASNTEALYKTASIRALATAHEQSANVDFAKFKIASNDMELSLVKQGINGNETDEQLEALVESGSAYAQYSLALKLKGESEVYEGRALELLKASAEDNYHPAMLDYALAVANDNQALYIEMLENSAKNGNTQAPWLLKNHYEQLAFNLRNSGGAESLDALKRAAYWFKISIEQENGDAVAIAYTYNNMIETIALWQAQEFKPVSNNNPMVLVALILAAIIGVGGIALAVFTIFGVTMNVPFKESTATDAALRYECQSESMSPALELGEYYYFTHVYDASTLEVGDIVLVDSGEMGRFAHRIHEITEVDGQIAFILKGDNNDEVDSRPFYEYEILGVLRDDSNDSPASSSGIFGGSASKKDEPAQSQPVQEEPDNLVIVDRVDGFDEAMAYDRFVDQGFNVKVKYKDTNDYPNGTVISQSVAYGTELERGSTITITVAREVVANITGQWQTAWRDGDKIRFRTFNFNSDGTFTELSVYWVNSELENWEYDEGWFAPAIGFPGYCGNYTVNGNQLTLNFTHIEWGDEYNNTEIFNMQANGNTLVLDGRTYYKGNYSQDEIIAKCGVDTSI